MAATFEDVYAASFLRVTRSVRTIAGRDAEDVANEAFAIAWSRWREVGSFDMPEAWVRKVARRIAVARVRRDADRGTREARSLAAPRTPTAADPDIWEALRRLPDDVREAVSLHYVEDRSVEEVAEALRTIPPTVKTWLHRARPRLATDVSGLLGRWVLDDLLSRDRLRERALAAGAADGIDAVMARMPQRRARWLITIDGARYLMQNDDGEYFDDGNLRWVDGTIRLRSTTAMSGEAVYALHVDGPSLAIRVEASSMPATDGVADEVYHTTMFDGLAFSWRGRERFPSRIYRG